MTTPRKPTPDEMLTAWAWLSLRPPGSEGEGEDCRVVADWLYAKAQMDTLRQLAHEHNVPLQALRREVPLTPYKGP